MNIFALFMALCLTACSFSSTFPEQVPTVPPVPVEPTPPVVAPTDVMPGGFDKFDDALIVYLRDSAKYTNENFAISPLSLKLAMGMVAEGAAGDTKSEILNAFGVSSGQTEKGQIPSDWLVKITSSSYPFTFSISTGGEAVSYWSILNGYGFHMPASSVEITIS